MFKKVLLSVAANIIVLSFLVAQNQELKTNNSKIVNEEKCLMEHSGVFIDKAPRLSSGNDDGIFPKKNGNNTVLTLKSRDGSKDDPFYVGEMYAIGTCYFWAQREWVVTIRADNENPNKFWVSKMLPDRLDNGFPAQNIEVYANLVGNTLQFPIGQLLCEDHPSEYQQIVLHGFNGSQVITTGTINAVIDNNNQTLTFATLGFGSQVMDSPNQYWNGIILPGAVFSSEKPIKPSYLAPEGMLYYGYADDGSYYAFIDNMAVYSAYSTWWWENLNPYPEATYTWTVEEFLGYQDENPVYAPYMTSNDVHLSMPVQAQNFRFPLLHGSLPNGNSGSFRLLGDQEDDNYSHIYAGGGSLSSGSRNYHLTNANNAYSSICYYSTDPGNFIYGTGGQSIALLHCFEKPLTTLYFEGVNIFINSDFTAPSGTVLTIEIYEYELDEEGTPVLGEHLCSAETLSNNVILGDAGIIKFDNMFVKNEWGFDVPIDYLETDASIAIKFFGYNIPGVNMCVRCENDSRPDTKYFSYQVRPDGSFYGRLTNTMFISLIEGLYSYIISTQNQIIAGDEGGDYTFTLIPYYNLAELINEDELPDWISNVTFNDHYVSENWGTDVTITVSPLPSNIEGRYHDLVFKTIGASVTVRVIQEGEVNIAVKNLSTLVLYPNPFTNEINISNPDIVKRVQIMNLAGQSVKGTSFRGKSISTGELANGVYFVTIETITGEKSVHKMVKK